MGSHLIGSVCGKEHIMKYLGQLSKKVFFAGLILHPTPI